jgi:glycosyltransferase involved in cell wall biosynthesis
MLLAQRASEKRARLYLLGHRNDVPDLLAGADLAVVTSDWEARQLFAQEALRAGVPLITTAVGGLPGLVGDAAVLIPPGDVDALDHAVRDLLADPALRADYAARGPRRAAEWPTEDDTVADVRSAYADVTSAVRAEHG